MRALALALAVLSLGGCRPGDLERVARGAPGLPFGPNRFVAAGGGGGIVQDTGSPWTQKGTGGTTYDSTTTNVTITTGGANRLVVALFAGNFNAAQTSNATVSGGGLTWVRWTGGRNSSSTAGAPNQTETEIYAALAPSTLTTQKISVTPAVNTSGDWVLAVYAVTGHKDTSTLANNLGANNHAEDVASAIAGQITLTGTTAGSLAVGCGFDGTNNRSWAALSNNAADLLNNDASVLESGGIFRYTGTLGGSATIGGSATTDQNLAFSAVEILKL